MNSVRFPPGSVPVQVASAVIGIDKNLLMNCMDAGEIDLGFVHKTPRRRGKRPYRKFYISPKKLYEMTGFIWQGEKTAKEVMSNAGDKANTARAEADQSQKDKPDAGC